MKAQRWPGFDELTQVLADIMPGWKIHQNFVAPVLQAAALDFHQVAYVNLLKWRTTASSGLARLYEISWQHHTREQVELLAPSRVIAIGSDAGRAFQRHSRGPVDFDFIPRHWQQRGASGPGSAGQNHGLMRQPQ